MRPQLIVDCGRVLSASIVTADGQLMPWSQEIRGTATRHVSADVLFDPRATEHPDFSWEEALETLSRATAANFLQRARKIGLRRPWDPQAGADALQLASPLSVLSSATALADRLAGPALPRVAMAMLDALLDPLFAFLADRQLACADVEPFVIVPGNTGRRAKALLQRLFRHRGTRRPVLLRRELAAAMARIEEPSECLVIDAADDELHLHRVAIEGDECERRVRTVSSRTIADRGWSHWAKRIAAALQTAPSAAFDRTLTSLLTGSPDSLDARLTRGTLQDVLDDSWSEAQRATLAFEAPVVPVVFAGKIFALDAVRRAFGVAATPEAPVLDQPVRGVAAALSWLRGGASRRLVIEPAGTLRIDTLRGEAVELIPHAQLPEPGQSCHVERKFRFGGEAGRSVLVHLLWGSDRAPAGNATVCAVPLALRGDSAGDLRLSVHLRRSRGGSRISGTIEARMTAGTVAARAQFAEELEVRR